MMNQAIFRSLVGDAKVSPGIPKRSVIGSSGLVVGEDGGHPPGDGLVARPQEKAHESRDDHHRVGGAHYLRLSGPVNALELRKELHGLMFDG